MKNQKRLAHTPQSIKTRLNPFIDEALEVMEKCLKDENIDSDKRYRIASDIIALYLRMDNEKRKEEEHRENMRIKKINSLKSEIQLADLEESSTNNSNYETQGSFSTKVVN